MPYHNNLPSCALFILWLHNRKSSKPKLTQLRKIHQDGNLCGLPFSAPGCLPNKWYISCFITMGYSGTKAKQPVNLWMGFPGSSDGKESACIVGDVGSIPGSGSSPGEGNGYSQPYSCLENFIDRGAWRATVHGVAKSWTWLSDWHFHTGKKNHCPRVNA